MKIKLFYIHPTNYGNLMMACVFMTRFSDLAHKKGIENVEYYLDVLDDKELERVKKSLPSSVKVYREEIFDRKRRGVFGKITKLVNIPKEISVNRREYDACVVLGGDCISQYYSKQVFISDMVKFCEISRKNKMFLAGQTMGPFSGYAVGLIGRCLKKCKIYLRDHDCYQYMKQLFPDFDLSENRDLAFLSIPYQDDTQIKDKVIERYLGNINKEYITVVASGANRQYTSSLEDYVNEYIKIIKYIIDEKNLDVLLLAHVIHVSDSNDKRIIDEIMKRIDKAYRKKIHVVNELVYPYEARILIGSGLATVTGRMHAAVSSINMGTVPICLSYSVKFKGVIGDDFGLNSYIYQCRGEEKWSSGKVHQDVCMMIDSILAKREEILVGIKSKLNSVQNKADEQIVDILKRIIGEQVL